MVRQQWSRAYDIIVVLAVVTVSKGMTVPDHYTTEELTKTEFGAWTKGKGSPARQQGRLIAGGRDAFSEEVPYMVTIQYSSDGSHFCGGAIYNELTIITAAHCFFRDNAQLEPKEIYIVAGKFSLKMHGEQEQWKDVVSITLFPGYKLYPGYNDLAILKIIDPFVFNDNVQPVRIAGAGEEPSGMATACGFGYSWKSNIDSAEHPEGYPDRLQKVDLEIIDRPTCIERHKGYAPKHAEHIRIICAGEGAGRDTCQGDSGGPLVCTDKYGFPYLCGIVQAGFGCGTHLPGFYTKVEAVRDFIISIGGSQPFD